MIASPVTGTTVVSHVRQIPAALIIESYRKEFDVNVSRFFAGVPNVDLYECGDTGYRFYHPFDVAGDAELYECLQRIPWYYSGNKEEHRVALKLAVLGQLVLEVGCGDGKFLHMLREKGLDSVGLEFNVCAVNKAISQGFVVYHESVEEHARQNDGQYDIVASFQVLEHVVDVKGFLSASLQALRHGGFFIVSVPNNDAAYHANCDDPLNMPPHHIGQWGFNSLIALQNYFPIRLERLETDTSTPAAWAGQKAMQAAKEHLNSRYGFIANPICQMGKKFISFGAQAMLRYIPGQTVTAIFRKV